MARGIEKGAVAVLRAAARPAVKKDGRDAAFCADLFDVKPVPVAHIQHARVERTEFLFKVAFDDGMRIMTALCVNSTYQRRVESCFVVQPARSR